MATDDALGATATSGASARVSTEPGGGLRVGAQFGRYTIERALGAGGMGQVYTAHDPDLDRRVAIKVLRGDASEESRVRLLREARAMAKVTHGNVVTVYEVGTAAGERLELRTDWPGYREVATAMSVHLPGLDVGALQRLEQATPDDPPAVLWWRP